MDTGSSKLWVFDDECKYCGNHNKYKSTDSETYEDVDDDFKIKYAKGSVKGKSVRDTVYLTTEMKVEG